MEWKVRSQLAAVALVSTSLLAGAHMAQAQSVPNGTRCSSSGQYKLAWTIPLRSSDVGARIESVIGRSEFSPVIEPRGATERVTVGRAPDGTLALQMNVSRGENDNVNFRLGQFGDPGVDAVCLSLRVFLESGFKFAPDGGMKMGWGLWGGSKYDSAGGTKPSNQRGWTLRNVNNSRYGFRLYSYHLNRPSQYGEQSGNIGKLIPGRWHTIDLEVVMNTPGRTDGYAQAWLDGGGRRIMDNLQFRKTADWAIRGLMFNDMWGGDVKDRENWSPQNQKMWYADYKLYTRNGSGGALARNNPSTSQSSGAKGSTASPRSGSGDVARLEEDLRIAKNRLRIAKERHARGEIPISNVRNREADVAAAEAALKAAGSGGFQQTSTGSKPKSSKSGGGSSGDVAGLEEDLRIAKNRLRIARERHARGEIPISNVRNREADVAAAEAALKAAGSGGGFHRISTGSKPKSSKSGGGSSGDVARLEEDLRIAKNRLRIAKERHARGDIPISNVRNREADVAAARAALRDV